MASLISIDLLLIVYHTHTHALLVTVHIVVVVDPKEVAQGIVELRAGRVLALPTDTIYGIAALAQSELAVRKIYRIKHRLETKPLAICVGNTEQVYR